MSSLFFPVWIRKLRIGAAGSEELRRGNLGANKVSIIVLFLVPKYECMAFINHKLPLNIN